jgi:hypothetical protein
LHHAKTDTVRKHAEMEASTGWNGIDCKSFLINHFGFLVWRLNGPWDLTRTVLQNLPLKLFSFFRE